MMRSLRHGAVACSAAALLMLNACSDSATGPDPVTEAPRPDPVGTPSFYSGVYLGDADSRPERVGAAVDAFTRLTGKRPALVKSFHSLDCDYAPAGWCGRLIAEVRRTGATPYLALDPRVPGAPDAGLLESIAAGAADARLVAMARGIAAAGDVVLVEPAWEMNGNWSYAWQGVANGAAAGPARYVAAWRRIVTVFRREGATNVRWVWNPNFGNPITGQASGPAHWNWYANYYPGGAYVDYVGGHGFNAPRLWGGGWNSFAEMTGGAVGDRMLEDLAARFPDKPILIGEMASDEGAAGQKAEWIRGAYAHMRANPRIAGAIWFHMDKEADWRVDSSATALAAYRDAMAAPGVAADFAPRPAAGALAAS